MMIMRRTALTVTVAIVSLMATACWASTLAPMIQFGAGADLSNNFSTVCGEMQYVATDDGGYGSGGFVESAGTWHNTIVYDVDKAAGGAGEVFGRATVDIDFKAGADGDGIGIWCLGDSDTGRSYKDWVFFQTNVNGATEMVRFFAGRNMVSNGGGSSQNGGNGYTADTSLAAGQWMHLRLDIDNSAGTSASATLSVYDSQTRFDASTLKLQTSWTYSASVFSASSEVGIGLYPNGVQIDNFAVYELGTAPTNLVPEPCSLAIVATGMLGLLAYAWRRRK